MPLGLHDIIDLDRRAAFPDPKVVIDYREYFRGNQKGTHTPAQAKLLHGVLGHPFCDNVCKKIITEKASRHELLGFKVDSEPVAAFLADLFIRNHLAALHHDVAVATLRDGNYALALRWQATDPARPSLGRVTMHREPWWDGTSGIFVAYGGDGQPEYAAKDWHERNADGDMQKRRVVWFPDHFERYIEQGDGWRAFPLPIDPEGSNGIVPWVKRDGTPLGIPVIHFANSSDDDSPYGASELAGGTLGSQDQINDLHLDITATARMTGYQMYTATGVVPERDDAGNPKALVVGPGQTLQSSNPDARFDVLAAGEVAPQKDALMAKKESLFLSTDVPLHIITGQWPSGTALLRSEMPLVADVNRFNNAVGPPWATLAHRSTEMANTFGEGDRLDESVMIVAEFAPPERLDALTLAEIDKAKADALLAREMLQDRESLIALGLTEEEADGILRRRQEREEAFDVRLTGIGGEGEEEAA